MITSATGGEGKTTLAAHLAARCANARTSTLLIDADMRRASLGRLLDCPAARAWPMSWPATRRSRSARSRSRPAASTSSRPAPRAQDPSRVLKSTRLSELLGRLRQPYDLVIIDTPPVLPVADALIVGRWADGAVMAARFDASRIPLVERANRQLATGRDSGPWGRRQWCQGPARGATATMRTATTTTAPPTGPARRPLPGPAPPGVPDFHAGWRSDDLRVTRRRPMASRLPV